MLFVSGNVAQFNLYNYEHFHDPSKCPQSYRYHLNMPYISFRPDSGLDFRQPLSFQRKKMRIGKGGVEGGGGNEMEIRKSVGWY